VLEARGITVRFGGHIALDDVTMTAAPAAITGVIGPNGAGKTTLFDVLTGLRRPQHGSVWIDGTDVTSHRPPRRSREGLARTFQSIQLFGTLTVRENIGLGVRSRDRRRVAARVGELVEQLGLGDVADEVAQRLPTGRARLVELGRALATSPSYLLLDEPASGLDELEVPALKAVLRAVAAQGVGGVLVEHDVPMVMDLCDTIHVLDFGQHLVSGDPAAVGADPKVQAAYLGTAP
jgi:branched-chain amino acid transport system ATP-binding protein